MSVPIAQMLSVGSYIARKKLGGGKRFPLVLMLEPLFRCNLSCSGCGKTAYAEDLLNKRLGASECVAAAEECGAPVVSIAGGEPLLHPEIGDMVTGLTENGRFVYLCTNALLLKRSIGLFTPSANLTLSVHLDGFKKRHDSITGLDGAFDRAVGAIRLAVKLGFRVTTNTTIFGNVTAEEAARFFDFVTGLGVEGMTISPGFEYKEARSKETLARASVHTLFKEIFRLGKGRRWSFNHSGFYLDFLAGNRDYDCAPWGNPTLNVFGWQRPCYLINDGYAASYRELMEETEWERWGRSANPACENCMVHCGYEPTAVMESIRNPVRAVLSRSRLFRCA